MLLRREWSFRFLFLIFLDRGGSRVPWMMDGGVMLELC